MSTVRLALAACASLAFGAGCGDGDSGNAGGDNQSGSSSSSAIASTSTAGPSSSSTGVDLEAQCAARTPPDCGDFLTTGCGLVTGYRFEPSSEACTTDDVPCDGATPVQHCLFTPPGTPHLQSLILIQRVDATGIDVVFLSSWPAGLFPGWEACFEGPACDGWEEY